MSVGAGSPFGTGRTTTSFCAQTDIAVKSANVNVMILFIKKF